MSDILSLRKSLVYILILFAFLASCLVFYKTVGHEDYRRDSRHFFCTNNGHCVTVWRTREDMCYIILGKYISSIKPLSQSYIKSTFTKEVTIIWPKNSDEVLVYLQDKKEQSIHNTSSQNKIIDYSLNEIKNDSTFFYFDGNYHRYKKGVEFLTIDILQEHATSSGD